MTGGVMTGKIRFVDPLADLGAALLGVEKPVRYAGGEYGRLAKKADMEGEGTLKTLIAFPDLYEIGMSNQALRIIYNGLNGMEGVSCDRAFVPAPDFEALLREKGLPLYGLDTGISLKSLDLLLVTLGYELGITGLLSMLDLSAIPLRSANRTGEDPIVIMGGPCVANPLPYSPFVDAFWIGEAEAGFFELASSLGMMKRAGASRQELLEALAGRPSVWVKGKGRALRAVYHDFSSGKAPAAVFPIPNMKAVQHHGAVEIMRGCPKGCRFCQAGFWYRPMRQKSIPRIREETAAFVEQGGYGEVSLSSLSSGDYEGIEELVDSLNRDYGERHVSFQLPSLRVSSFSLPLLEKISAVRKSGLTFAVETPVDSWQRSINKEVSKESVIAILKEARRRGWRGAKFYFMLGLPLEGDFSRGAPEGEGGLREEREILRFILDTARETGMHFNVNLGVFVPKPGTPYQRAGQMGEEEARQKLRFLQDGLKPRGHRVGIQDPLISTIEGIICRGDERAGELIEAAFKAGCRLDAWSEYLKKDVWKRLIEEREDLIRSVMAKREANVPLPWDFVRSGVAGTYLKKELERSHAGEITSLCMNNCNDPCGVCNKEHEVVKNIIQIEENPFPQKKAPLPLKDGAGGVHRILFSYAKTGTGIFYSHLSLMEIFGMAMIRAGLPIAFSEGFNPLPRLEIASPLSIGIEGLGEIASVETAGPVAAEEFIGKLNRALPAGIGLLEGLTFYIPRGQKKHSVSSLLWGFVYANGEGSDIVPREEEKKYRLERMGAGPVSGDSGGKDEGCRDAAALYGLRRLKLLAKKPGGGEEEPSEGISFFGLFGELYGA
jgi:radical SAM family uncharacterized protein